MLKSLRRRFVLTAMLSLLILLSLLLCGIGTAGYIMMERDAAHVLDVLAASPAPGRSPPRDAGQLPLFGYRVEPGGAGGMNSFSVTVDGSGAMLSFSADNPNRIDEETAEDCAASALSSGRARGKVGAYKYLATAQEDGSTRLVFLDVSVRAQTLASTLLAAALAALLCMALMFVILLLVSRRAVAPIAASMEKQRRFVTDAGHEIKTPLAIILANTDAMELNLGESKWSRNIRSQTLRLSGLMKRLLALSKLDEGAAAELSDVDLSALLREALDAFAELAGAKRLDTEIEDGVAVRGDGAGLEQLVSILLDNAVKYSDREGNIKVRLFKAGRRAVLEVSNSCEALPEAPPETLFDRFYRADKARTQSGGGYGIGLSIARGVAEAHRGRLTAFYDSERVIRFRAEL